MVTLIFALFITVISGLIIRLEGRLENYAVMADIWSILSDPYVATVIVYAVWALAAFLGLIGSVHDLRALLVTFFTVTVTILILHVVAYVGLFATEKYQAYFFTPLHSTLFIFGFVIIGLEIYGQIFVLKHVKQISRQAKLKLLEPPPPDPPERIYFTSDFKKRAVTVESPVYDDTEYRQNQMR